MKDKAGQKHKPIIVFDFPDTSSLGRQNKNKKDEES